LAKAGASPKPNFSDPHHAALRFFVLIMLLLVLVIDFEIDARFLGAPGGRALPDIGRDND
jgi:hypothetical protein